MKKDSSVMVNFDHYEKSVLDFAVFLSGIVLGIVFVAYIHSGIKPEWMQVQRIINHVQYGKTQFDYLVKWRELVYEQATWERDDFDIMGYEEAILKYWTHRFLHCTFFGQRMLQTKFNTRLLEVGNIHSLFLMLTAFVNVLLYSLDHYQVFIIQAAHEWRYNSETYCKENRGEKSGGGEG